jgi:hypothetical protein
MTASAVQRFPLSGSDAPATPSRRIGVTLGTDERGPGRLAAARLGDRHHPGRSSDSSPRRSDIWSAHARCPSWPVRALGSVSPMIRALAEMACEFDVMACEFDEAFILGTSKYQSTLGPAGAFLAAIATTPPGTEAGPARHD